MKSSSSSSLSTAVQHCRVAAFCCALNEASFPAPHWTLLNGHTVASSVNPPTWNSIEPSNRSCGPSRLTNANLAQARD